MCVIMCVLSIVKYGSCHIEKTFNGENSAGMPLLGGRTQITYSCTAKDNCLNSVHAISVYEARSTGFSVQAGTVQLSVSVTGEDAKPLILILTSYFPIRWFLSIPQGVVLDRVIVVNQYTYCIATTANHFYLPEFILQIPQSDLCLWNRIGSG